MRRSGHWTEVYRTDPLTIYETEAPIFTNAELTRQELELVSSVAAGLGAEVASPVLDLACGPGRHSLELAARSFQVVGVDHSEGLLGIAAGRAARRPPDRRPRLVCADLLSLPFDGASFRTALLLGKSFGYFSDELNRSLLEGVRALLAPGGLFCVELPDREPYLASMPPVETVERPGLNGERLVSDFACRWIEESKRLVVRETHTLAGSGERLWFGEWDVRLYTADEMIALLRRVGFREVNVRGSQLVEAAGAKPDVLVVGALR